MSTVVWLASDGARFVTGIVVPVDGGFSAFSGVWGAGRSPDDRLKSVAAATGFSLSSGLTQ